MFGVSLHKVRVTVKREVAQIGLSRGEVELPLYMAIKLDEYGVVEIGDSEMVKPGDVATLKYREQKERQLVKLPEDFYSRVRLTLYLLNKRGDTKQARLLAGEVRDLARERLRKMVELMTTAQELDFLDKLTPEERALAISLHTSISTFLSQ